MKIGVSQLIMGDVPCSEFFNQAAMAGYEAVEVCLRPDGEVREDMDDTAIRQIHEGAALAGIEIVSIALAHSGGNMLDTGEAQREGIRAARCGLELAARMGIGCALTTLGRLRPDLYYEDGYRNAIASLKELAPHAERLGVTLAVEFVWNGFLFSPLEMRSLLDEVGSDRIGFYFDPGNMAVFQYPHHWVRALGSRVKMVHMKDWRGHALTGGWTALLDGEVDFAAIMRELRAAGYTGPLISEVEPSLATLKATAAMMLRIREM